MRLTPPRPEIDLYKEGFGDNDVLGRKKTSAQLSNIIEKVEEPLVICLDGEWGTGKSFFLQYWCGAHTLQNDGTATTVYFDAFRNDVFDEPLISLSSVVIDRLQAAGVSPTKLTEFKATAAGIAKHSSRMAFAMAKELVKNYTGDIVDAAVDSFSDDLTQELDDFWKQESGKRHAMEHFRKTLEDITTPDGDTPPHKIAIVIDELDRCRPDYALALLETAKHFFDVPNVHFVLGTNIDQLANAVKQRYGSEIDGRKYLEKFVTLTMSLRSHLDRARDLTLTTFYLETLFIKMNIPKDVVSALSRYTTKGQIMRNRTLRDADRLATSLATLSIHKASFKSMSGGDLLTLTGAAILKALYSEKYRSLLEGRLHLEHVDDGTLYTEQNVTGRDQAVRSVWGHLLGASMNSPKYSISEIFGAPEPFALGDGQRYLKELVVNHLETFELTTPSTS